MELLKLQKSFIIIFHSGIKSFDNNVRNSGGASVMIELCKMINIYYKKDTAFIINSSNLKEYLYKFRKRNYKKHDQEFIKFIRPDEIFLINNILITHHMIDNFLNLKNHITLNLYFSDKIYDNVIYYSKTFFDSEKKLSYLNPNLNEIKHKNILMNDFFIPANLEIILEKCFDKKYNRDTNLYLLKKGIEDNHNIKLRKEINYIHPDNSILLKYKDIDELIEKFNKAKYFYSYDPFTFLNTISSLCGCITIIVPFANFKNITEIYSEKFCHYGLAYGDNEQEIEYAIRTTHKVREELQKYDDKYFENKIDSLIQLLKTKFNFK